MGVAEIKVTFSSVTNLPEDDIVNVFHVASVPATPGDLVAPFVDFYNNDQAVSSRSIASFMSPEISRSALSASIDVYDLADPTPRVPVASGGFTPTAAVSTSGLPAEVALCVSWNAALESGVPIGRLRGRNFLGPWGIECASATEPSRPIGALIDTIASAAEELLSDVALVIYSKATTPAVARAVVGGYVDNAWDTMRSRGPDTTSRVLFTGP